MDGTNKAENATGIAHVGWVSPPNSGRSTWGILWSCLTIFLICSWKCTHLDIPSIDESKAGCITWMRIPTKLLLRKWGRKLLFMGITAIAPEVVVSLAATQYVRAYLDTDEVNKSRSDNDKFTMTHAYFARMGGFVAYFNGERPWTETKSREEAGDADPEAAKATSKTTSNFTAAMVLNLAEIAQLKDSDYLFNADKEDIKDRAKTDSFTKLFALVQAGWLVLQSCARKAAGLQITQLELMTMGFTVCALATYILWWDKPFGAQRSVAMPLQASHLHVLENMHQPRGFGRGEWRRGLQWHNSHPLSNFTELNQAVLINMIASVMITDGDKFKDRPGLIGSLVFYASGGIFSAIHFGAWNWTFPLPVVQTLWRSFCCAALGSSMLPLLIFGVIGVSFRTGHDHDYITGMADFLVPVLLIINVIARLVLIGLTFYCFTSMPASAYQDLDWTQFLPHFS